MKSFFCGLIIASIVLLSGYEVTNPVGSNEHNHPELEHGHGHSHPETEINEDQVEIEKEPIEQNIEYPPIIFGNIFDIIADPTTEEPIDIVVLKDLDYVFKPVNRIRFKINYHDKFTTRVGGTFIWGVEHNPSNIRYKIDPTRNRSLIGVVIEGKHKGNNEGKTIHEYGEIKSIELLYGNKRGEITVQDKYIKVSK